MELFVVDSQQILTLAGGVVNGLLSNSNETRLDIFLNSTGNTEIRLPLMSNDTNCRLVTSKKKNRKKNYVDCSNCCCVILDSDEQQVIMYKCFFLSIGTKPFKCSTIYG